MNGYELRINFMPIEGGLASFRIYRQERLQTAWLRPEGVRGFSLPMSEENGDIRRNYWVSPVPLPGFTEFSCRAGWNRPLTQWLVFAALCDAASRQLHEGEFLIRRGGFIQELSFVMNHHPEGDELLVVQPYFLRAESTFGCLLDFHFRLAKEAKFSRKVQQLSLSLDRDFRRNLDYYVDRSSRVRSFLALRRQVLEDASLPGSESPLKFASDFTALPGARLTPRVYMFGDGGESRSQFNGLRDHGPLTGLDSAPTILFAFREQDRAAARTLASALRGTHRGRQFTFPGFAALFKTQPVIDGNPIVLSDFTQASMQEALLEAQRRPGLTLPVFVMPEGDHEAYLTHKAVFTNAGVPTQVCTLPVIQDDTTLKWSIANIALQVFCKAGGEPWKVRPTGDRSLIIGISQSHKTKQGPEGRVVEKYLAFSVLTDSSGLFQRIQVLGESDEEGSYLSELRSSLASVLSESAEEFSRIAVHTSFKLRRQEIETIREAVAQAARTESERCRFAVAKVNHRHRFFGVNERANSLVPYAGTTVRLGPGEYLVWFEGILPDSPTVTKAFPGPTHVEFLRMSPEASVADTVLLQDLLNLSGANWRGFNAKSAPVSVFYCHLVADIVQEFHDRGLPLPAVTDLRPWFL